MNWKRWLVLICAGLIGVCLILAAVSAVVNRNLPAESSTLESLSPLEKARITELFHLQDQVGDSAWPGWGSADIPLIVYNEQYAFLIGYRNPPAGWTKVGGQEVLGGPWELVSEESLNGEAYYRQRLPADGTTPQAFTVQVGDRWVASMPTKEWTEISLRNQFREDLPAILTPIFPYALVSDLFLRGSDGYISLVAHESFHAFQGMESVERLSASERDVSRATSEYPWEDPALQAAWQRELDMLAEALRAESEAEVIALAQQFLTARQERRDAANLEPLLVEYEMQREWLEGLARYLELEVWRQADLSETYEPAPAIVDDPDFAGYETFDNRWEQEIDQIGRMADDEGDGRFYYSGMALAVMLDRLMPDWKSEILAGEIFLEDLLSEAVSTGSD